MPSNRLCMMLVMFSVAIRLLYGLIATAAADPPTRESVPLTPFTIPAEPVGCSSFDVLVEPLTNKETMTTFFDQEGDARFSTITGSLKVRFTNLSTGQSVDLNISGPYRIEPQPDGGLIQTTYGPTFFWFSDPGVAPGFPLLALFHGKTVSEFDADGNFALRSVKGAGGGRLRCPGSPLSHLSNQMEQLTSTRGRELPLIGIPWSRLSQFLAIFENHQ